MKAIILNNNQARIEDLAGRLKSDAALLEVDYHVEDNRVTLVKESMADCIFNLLSIDEVENSIKRALAL